MRSRFAWLLAGFGIAAALGSRLFRRQATSTPLPGARARAGPARGRAPAADRGGPRGRGRTRHVRGGRGDDRRGPGSGVTPPRCARSRPGGPRPHARRVSARVTARSGQQIDDQPDQADREDCSEPDVHRPTCSCPSFPCRPSWPGPAARCSPAAAPQVQAQWAEAAQRRAPGPWPPACRGSSAGSGPTAQPLPRRLWLPASRDPSPPPCRCWPWAGQVPRGRGLPLARPRATRSAGRAAESAAGVRARLRARLRRWCGRGRRRRRGCGSRPGAHRARTARRCGCETETGCAAGALTSVACAPDERRDRVDGVLGRAAAAARGRSGTTTTEGAAAKLGAVTPAIDVPPSTSSVGSASSATSAVSSPVAASATRYAFRSPIASNAAPSATSAARGCRTSAAARAASAIGAIERAGLPSRRWSSAPSAASTAADGGIAAAPTASSSERDVAGVLQRVRVRARPMAFVGKGGRRRKRSAQRNERDSVAGERCGAHGVACRRNGHCRLPCRRTRVTSTGAGAMVLSFEVNDPYRPARTLLRLAPICPKRHGRGRSGREAPCNAGSIGRRMEESGLGGVGEEPRLHEHDRDVGPVEAR